MNDKNTVKKTQEISGKRLVWIVLSTVVGTAVTTFFATIRIANTDHFTIKSNSARVQALEESCVAKDLYYSELNSIKEDIKEIKSDIKLLLTRY